MLLLIQAPQKTHVDAVKNVSDPINVEYSATAVTFGITPSA